MIVGILSDTHGRANAARAAVQLLRERGAEFLIHCGDVGSDSVLDEMAGTPSALVWGNNDYDRRDLARYAETVGVACHDTFADLTVGGKRFAVTHGDDPRLIRRAIESGLFDYLLLGHTHVPRDERVGKLRIVNPGALHRASRKTVGVLDTEKDRLEIVGVENIQT